MSIIGRRNLGRLKSRKREPSDEDRKNFERYYKRNDLLSELGYASYKEYLQSDDWKMIRARILAANNLCVMCESKATQVHHVKYYASVMLGISDTRLASLCGKCHETIEIKENGDKRRPGLANEMLFREAAKTAAGRKWLQAFFDACNDLRQIDGKKPKKVKEPSKPPLSVRQLIIVSRIEMMLITNKERTLLHVE